MNLSPKNSRFAIRDFLPVSAFAAAYFLSAELGRFLTANSVYSETLWPPSGITISMLLLTNRRRWWMYILAAIPANIAFDMCHGTTLVMSFFYTAGNCSEYVIGAWLLQSLFKGGFRLNTLKEFFALIGIGAIGCTMISATVNTLAAVLFEHDVNILSSWKIWWAGDFAGVLLFAPLLLTWSQRYSSQHWMAFSRRRREAVATFLLIALMSSVLYLFHLPYIPKLDLLLIPPLLFASLRFDMRFTSMLNVVFACIAIWGALHGFGTHSSLGIERSLVLLSTQIYVGGVVFLNLFVAVIVKEHADVAKSLQESELKYRTLVELAGDAIEMMDLDGKPLFRNTEYYSSLGYSPDDSVNPDGFSIIHPDDAGKMNECASRILEKGETTLDYRVQHRDGHWIHRRTKASVIYDASKQPTAILLVIRDETERKKAENALRESEERYRALVETSPLSIAVHQDGRLVYMNPACSRMLGIEDSDAFLGTPIVSFVHPDYRDFVSERMQTISTRNVLPVAIEQLLKPDGSEIVAEVTSLMSVFEGKPAVQVVMQDITERKKAEDSLRTSEHLYRSLFENMQEGFAYCRMYFDSEEKPDDFEYITVNKSFYQIVGVHDVMGKMVSEIFPGIKEISPELFEIYGRVARTGQQDHFETNFLPLQKWLSISVYSPAQDCFIAVFEDITERKNAETVLRDSEERYRLISQNTADTIWIFNLETNRFTFISPSVERMLGFTHDEAMERTLGQAFTGQSFEKISGSLAQRKEAMRKGDDSAKIVTDELDQPCKDGSIRHTEVVSTVITDKKGRAIEVLGVSRDISDRKHTEDALRESEKSYRELFESVKDAIYILTPDGIFVDVNAGAEKMYGYSREEFIGRTPAFLSPPGANDLDDTMRRVRCVCETGESQVLDWWGLRKNGEIFPKEISFNKGRYFGKTVLIAAGRDITERKSAEEALRKSERSLRESETRLKAMFDTAGTAIGLVDKSGKWLQCNRYWMSLFGYSEEEAHSLTVVDLTHPDDLEDVAMKFAQLAAGKIESFRLEKRFFIKNHRIVWGDLSVAAIRDANEEVQYYLSVCTDITERKLTEQHLRLSEVRFRSITEQMTDMVFITDETGSMTYISPAVEYLFGYTYQEVLGQEFTIYFDPADAEIAMKKFKTAGKKNKVSQSIELRMRQRDGSVFYGEFSMTSYQIGGTKGTLGVIRDITHRKLAEEALYQSVQRFRDISEATGEFIWETDEKGNITYLSNRFEQILGFTIPEVLGRTPFSFLARNDAEWNSEFWTKEIYITKGVRDIELLTRNKTGKQVWLSVTVLPIFDKDRQISGFRGAALDITERKLAEKVLEESLEEKIALLKEVHHRVKNNLQIVISMLNLQAQGIEDPHVVRTLLDTQNRVRSMALLHEALYTSGNLARINFSEYVKGLCAHLYRSFGQDPSRIGLNLNIGSVNLTLEIAIPCGLIINELVSNSLKHAYPDGRIGRIEIVISSDGENTFSILVSDDGIGIPADLDIAQSKTLGLRLIRNLARQLGGVADFVRKDGTSCSLTFNLQEN